MNFLKLSLVILSVRCDRFQLVNPQTANLTYLLQRLLTGCQKEQAAPHCCDTACLRCFMGATNALETPHTLPDETKERLYVISSIAASILLPILSGLCDSHILRDRHTTQHRPARTLRQRIHVTVFPAGYRSRAFPRRSTVQGVLF